MARSKTPSTKKPAREAHPVDPLVTRALDALRRPAESLPTDVSARLAPLLGASVKDASRDAASAKALAKSLGDTDEAVAVFDAVAASLFERGARAMSHAANCHAGARAIERKRKRKVDLDVACDIAEALSTGGAVWVKELVQLAKASRAAKRVELAERITRASIATVRHGEVPTDDLVTALAALAPAHAVTALAAWIDDDKALESFDDALWSAAAPWLGAALDASPAALAKLVAERVGRVRPQPGFLRAFAAASVGARVAKALPERARPVVERALAVAGKSTADTSVFASLEALLPPLFATMRARGETLAAVMTEQWDSRAKFHSPELAEMLLALDAPLSFEHAENGVFDLYLWGHSAVDLPYSRLDRLAAHPVYGPRLGVSVERSLDNSGLAAVVAKLASLPAGKGALEHLAVALLGALADRGTLGAFDALREPVSLICQPAALAACHRLGEAVHRLDAARLLRAQLRGGLMDEWGWPALDEAAERIGQGFSIGASVFPHLVMHKGDRVVVAGVDGVALDHTDPVLASEYQWLRAGIFVDGDLLCVAGNYKTRWLIANAPVEDSKLQMANLVDLIDRGGVMTIDGRPLKRGEMRVDPGLYGPSPYFDGEILYVRHGTRAMRHEPVTGRELPDGELPWTQRPGQVHAAFLMAVPRRAVSSPLGARDGIGGFVSWSHGTGSQRAERIDGVTFTSSGAHGWGAIDALITFPEREGVYPVLRTTKGTWVHLPDGLTPLVSTDGERAHKTWAAGPARLGIPWWHNYVPRDREASRAFASCSLDRASALLSAARDALSSKPASEEPNSEELTGYPGLRVTMTKPHESVDALALWPSIASAAREIFPEVTHPRVLAGLVHTAVFAVEIEAGVADLVRRVEAASTTSQSSITNDKVRRLERFFVTDFSLPGRWGQDRLGQQILDVAAFLFRDESTEGVRPVVSTVPPCFVAWERVLLQGSALFTTLLGPATTTEARDHIKAFLALWRSTPLASVSSSRCRVAGFSFATAPFADLHHDRPDRLAAWENRYFLRWRVGTTAPCSFAAIEVSRDGVFRVPPGATLDWARSIEHNSDAARIDEALSLLSAKGAAKLDEEAVATLSADTGILRDSAAMVLSGAWLDTPDKETRAALGTTASRLAFVEEDLRVTTLHDVVASAVPRALDELYAPLSSGSDGRSLVARLTSAWNASVGRKHPLPVDLVERIEEDIRNPYPPFLRAARALSSPSSFACFTESKRWVHRPFHIYSRDALRFGAVPSGWPTHGDTPESTWAPRWPDPEIAFSYETLANYMKYLSWAHLELPVGDPLRVGAGEIASLIEARLASPDHLLPAAWGSVDDRAAFEAFIASLDARPYDAGDGRPSAEGVERRGVVIVWPTPEDQRYGAFITLRTAHLASDEALSAALATLGATCDAWRVSVSVPGAQFESRRYLALYLLWRSEGFRALAAELRAPSLPRGSHAADPRVSAPKAVAAVRERHALDEDSATLLLQIRALAEPTPARVRRYNGWTRARYDAAAAALVAKGLIEPVSYKGSSRAHGLSGPVAFFERYPAPVERAKLVAYGLTEGEVPPLDVPLPLRPVSELFSERAQ